MAIGFEPGEVFVYQRGEDHLELGQVKRANDDGTGYFCWYSTGDTAANTPTRCMRKLANAGWSHVERGTCRNLYEPGEFKCSECGHFTMAKMVYRDGTPSTPRYCPWCGRKVVE